MKNPFKVGDKVRYKKNDDSIYRVYAVYSNKKVSLGLKEYPDTEPDFQTDIKDINGGEINGERSGYYSPR